MRLVIAPRVPLTRKVLMARSASAPSRQRGRFLLPSILTLALWRLRQTWQLLMVTGLGLLVAVVIACAAPLYTQVSMTAGLRGVLNADPQDSELTLQATVQTLSPAIAQSDNLEFSTFMQQSLGSYLSNQTDRFIELPLEHIAAPPALADTLLGLVGTSISRAAGHVNLLQGRLPQSTASALELAITQSTAQTLGLSIGSTLTLQLPVIGFATPLEGGLPLRIVGIFATVPNDPFWHLQDFEPGSLGRFHTYAALMSDDAFLAQLGQIASQHNTQFLTFSNTDQPTLSWYYHLNVAQMRIAQLDDLMARLNQAQTQIFDDVTAYFGENRHIAALQFFGPALDTSETPSILERFRSRVALVQVPTNILLIQIVALILFFISLTASILTERQAEVIALLRSRGASRRQVFGAFVAQALGLGLIALIAGPLLAIPTVRLLAQQTLAPPDQQALNAIGGNPVPVALSVGWFALAATICAVLTLLLAVRGAARRDVLEMRRESARAVHRTLWQQIHLDLIAAIIALTGFLLSLYVAHAGVADVQTNLLISAPLALVAPICLVITGILFFLRLFPPLLSRAAQLASRRADAAPLLALAQMARAPQQALRMILLLALASNFAIFTFIFTTSETRQISSVAAYQTGADFSGSLPLLRPPYPTLAQQTARYQSIAGVLGAALGYAGDATPDQQALTMPLTVRAVDTRTFAQAAIWTDQDSTQPLGSLVALLQRHVPQGIPAILDTRAWNALGLKQGVSFGLTINNQRFIFTAVAEIQHIPTVNDSLVSGGAGDYTPPGGILIDYQDLANAYDVLTAALNVPPLQPNTLWLRTSDSPSLLASIRAALTSGPLQLQSLNDRRAMIAQLERDPLYLTLTGVLALGTSATLLLALAGSLLASWLSVRKRLTTFALLRALGSAPRQIAAVLTWEQAFVYTAALALGILFGALLAATVVPALVFTGAPNQDQALSTGEFYTIQHILPTQVVIPLSLLIVFAALIALCALALGMMARLVSNPSISQTLRLDED